MTVMLFKLSIKKGLFLDINLKTRFVEGQIP
jgi:hypothetical protein